MEKKQRHCTGTFLKLPSGKQTTILNAAKTEFAARGFSAANINTIADKAGISIGGLYRYFRTKEDLFLEVIEIGLDVLYRVLEESVAPEGDIYGSIENILLAAYQYSIDDPEMIRMYIDITGEHLTDMAKRLSGKMESLAAETYALWIRKAAEEGQVYRSIDPGIAAFFLDNIFLIFQFSFASEYYRERLKVFTGNGTDRVQTLIKELTALIRYGLEGPRENP